MLLLYDSYPRTPNTVKKMEIIDSVFMLLFHIETYHTFYKEVQDIVESRDVIRFKDKNNI